MSTMTTISGSKVHVVLIKVRRQYNGVCLFFGRSCTMTAPMQFRSNMKEERGGKRLEQKKSERARKRDWKND